MDFYFSFEAFQSLLLSISIDPGTEKHNPSHRILMLVRQRRRWFVQHMHPHWLFITAARYEERLHPSSSSNEFLHAELNSVSGHLGWAVCEEDKDWAAIIAYYVTALQDPPAKKWGGCSVEDEDEGAGRRASWVLWACSGFSSVRRVRGPSVQTSSLSCGAHGGINGKALFFTRWHRLMFRRYNADSSPGVSCACTLMSCAAACCCGD